MRSPRPNFSRARAPRRASTSDRAVGRVDKPALREKTARRARAAAGESGAPVAAPAKRSHAGVSPAVRAPRLPSRFAPLPAPRFCATSLRVRPACSPRTRALLRSMDRVRLRLGFPLPGPLLWSRAAPAEAGERGRAAARGGPRPAARARARAGRDDCRRRGAASPRSAAGLRRNATNRPRFVRTAPFRAQICFYASALRRSPVRGAASERRSELGGGREKARGAGAFPGPRDSSSSRRVRAGCGRGLRSRERRISLDTPLRRSEAAFHFGRYGGGTRGREAREREARGEERRGWGARGGAKRIASGARK